MGLWSNVGDLTIHLLDANPYLALNVEGPGPYGSIGDYIPDDILWEIIRHPQKAGCL